MSEFNVKYLAENVGLGFNYTPWWETAARRLGAAINKFLGPVPDDVVIKIITEDLVTEPIISPTTLDIIEGYVRVFNRTTGTTLQVASDGYKIHRPEVWCREAAMPLIEAGRAEGMGVASVLSLGDGRYSAITLQLPESVTAAGMELRPYTMLATSGDGSLATQVNNGAIVGVCDNTARWAQGSGVVTKMKHTSKSGERYDGYVNTILMHHGYVAAVVERVEMLASIPLSEEDWQRCIVAQLGPVPDAEGAAKTRRMNAESALLRMAKFDERCSPWRGTALGALQTLNTYTTHEASVKGDRAVRMAERAVTGQQAKIDAEFLKIISTVTADKRILVGV